MADIKQLRCFVTLAEELNFHRAAEALNMTQSPFSRQIQLLEASLDLQLVKRTSRSVRLTSAGEVFHQEAKALLALLESAIAKARQANDGLSGQIAIGHTAAATYSLLPDMIALAKERLPAVDLVLQEMLTLEQVEALRSRRIDLGFLRPPVVFTGISGTRVFREPLVLAVPQASPLSGKDPLTMQDLHGQPFINYPPQKGSYFNQLLGGLFQIAGIAPEVVQYTYQPHSILAMVSAGIGIAIVPAAATNLKLERVVFRALPTPTPVYAELYLAWRTGDENLAASVFRSLIIQHCQTISGLPLPDRVT